MPEVSKPCVLVIGAGGIGRALCDLLTTNGEYDVHCITRAKPSNPVNCSAVHIISDYDEAAISGWCSDIGFSFSLVFCTTGFLHDEHVKPEKKLEDINADNMLKYFQVNTVIPSLWLKYGVRLFDRKLGGKLVLLSARVGSISDNKLGGWYGYRASKSALNMMIKTARIEYARRSPNVNLIAYHPGTVDTGLSAPFQARVPEGKLFSPAQCAGYLTQVVDSLQLTETAHYVDWRGNAIPW